MCSTYCCRALHRLYIDVGKLAERRTRGRAARNPKFYYTARARPTSEKNASHRRRSQDELPASNNIKKCAMKRNTFDTYKRYVQSYRQPSLLRFTINSCVITSDARRLRLWELLVICAFEPRDRESKRTPGKKITYKTSGELRRDRHMFFLNSTYSMNVILWYIVE